MNGLELATLEMQNRPITVPQLTAQEVPNFDRSLADLLQCVTFAVTLNLNTKAIWSEKLLKSSLKDNFFAPLPSSLSAKFVYTGEIMNGWTMSVFFLCAPFEF